MVGRMRYAPTTGYVRFFEIPMRSPNWVRVRVQKMDLYTPPTVAYGGAYAIRPYDRVRAALQKTVPFSSPLGPSVGCMRYAPTTGTCGPSKNYPVFVPFGAVCGAYAIRPYKRVRAALQKTVPFSSPSGPLVGRMRYAPTTGYVRSFEIPIRSLDRRGGGVWEVGRWGLPFAGEGGVNEFGEEEDDNQDDDNEGARGDLQHKRQP